MSRKRQIVAAVLAFLLALGTTGCGEMDDGPEAGEDDRLKIVCTIFPEYDWVREILGEQAEEAELTLLMKNGADLHSYQPTVWDMRKIAGADLFLYVGGESDFWIEAALAHTENPGQITLNLMEILGESVKEEEDPEGVQPSGGHEHAGHGHHGEETEHEPEEYDEHVWLSLRNAQTACRAVTEALCRLDEAHGTLYEENNREYMKKLQMMDRAYAEAVEQASAPVLLFGDRFPFRYLAEDYGITCYAAFAGCSAETEASFETITFLAEKAGELGLPAVMKIDGSDGRIARTIAGNTRTGDQKVLLLNSMQSVSGQEIEAGETYMGIMERNLEALKEALAVTGGRSYGAAVVQKCGIGI